MNLRVGSESVLWVSIEEWNLEEHCVVIREGKIDQVHIKTVVQHKVMCVSFVMAGELHMLGQIK